MGKLNLNIDIDDVDRDKVPGVVDRVKIALNTIIPQSDIEVRFTETLPAAESGPPEPKATT